MMDSKKIKKNLEMIAFPRLAGTIYEQQANQLIKAEIEKLGLNPESQKFTFSTFYPRIYKKLAFTSISWLLIVFFIYINTIFILINIIILSLLFIPLILLTRNPEDIRIGKNFESENIFVKINAKNQGSRERFDKKFEFLLLCHKDSKSQRLTITIRSINIKIWIYSLIIAVICLLLKYFFLSNIFFNIFVICVIGINCLNTFLININTTGNKSPGAIDNASGVAIVLELLTYFSEPKNRLKNIDLWFIFTGAEENGTMGIRNFYKKHIKQYPHKELRYLNFDSLGSHLDTFAVKNKLQHTQFFKLFVELSKELNPTYHIKYFVFAVNRSDGYYLKNKNFKGLGFADKKVYKYIHSSQDTVDKVDSDFLEAFCKVIAKFLEEYDNNMDKNLI